MTKLAGSLSPFPFGGPYDPRRPDFCDVAGGFALGGGVCTVGFAFASSICDKGIFPLFFEEKSGMSRAPFFFMNPPVTSLCVANEGEYRMVDSARQ